MLADIIGEVFGRLTVISKTEQKSGGHYMYLALCSCGNEKLVLKTNLKTGKTTSCGCFHKERLSEFSTERHRVNREKTKGAYKSDRPRYNRFLTQTVFERDNYTCVLCGKLGGNLNAHHIVRWVDCQEKRDDPNNVITLCFDCHMKAHDRNLKTGLNLEIQTKLLSLI